MHCRRSASGGPAASSSTRAAERTAVAESVRQFGVVAGSLETPMRSLSGGNQQKALIARWHLAAAMVFVLIEPTHGVDVAARGEIYRRLDALAAAGKALVVVSSEIAEVLAIADRILVIRAGLDRRGDDAVRNRRGRPQPDDPGGRMNAPAHPSETSAGPHRAGAAFAAAGLLGVLREAPMVVAGVLLFVGFAATSSVFPTAANAENILRQAAPTLILGIAMALVVLVGGIDLSVGSVVIASATTAGIALQAQVPDALAMLAAISIGASVGTINAVLTEGLGMSPVVVTLGTMIAVRGLALSALGAYHSWINIDAPAFNALALTRIAGLPLDALLAVALAIIAWVALRRTVYGRRLYAVGDNPRRSPALRPADPSPARRRLYRLWSARRRRRYSGRRPDRSGQPIDR